MKLDERGTVYRFYACAPNASMNREHSVFEVKKMATYLRDLGRVVIEKTANLVQCILDVLRLLLQQELTHSLEQRLQHVHRDLNKVVRLVLCSWFYNWSEVFETPRASDRKSVAIQSIYWLKTLSFCVANRPQKYITLPICANYWWIILRNIIHRKSTYRHCYFQCHLAPTWRGQRLFSRW